MYVITVQFHKYLNTNLYILPSLAIFSFRYAGISHTSILISLPISIIVELKKISMNREKALRGLTIFAGPIGWSIAGIYCAELLRRQYCEIRRRKSKSQDK
jgi:hypothetical protein